ncbi:polymorphic toxin type 15 domain-containing protein [Streptococcus suis]
MVELLSDGSVNSLEEAEQQAKNWLSTQHALHDPDQIAGGFTNNVTGVGDAQINKAIGSQWKTRIGTVDEVVDEIARTTPYEDLSKIYLNVKLIP